MLLMFSFVVAASLWSKGRAAFELRMEGTMPLCSELFLLLSCARFASLGEASSESSYSVVRLLLGVVGCRPTAVTSLRRAESDIDRREEQEGTSAEV
jgi:hypothetical protein